MTTRTRVKKIDADTHFLPPVDMEELRQFLPKNYNKEAVNMLLRDAGVFADPNARRGGFRASAAGQRVTGGGNGAPGCSAATGWRCHWPRDPARPGWSPA